MRNPVWYPLRATVALVVSHDESFAKNVSQRKTSKHSPLQATLPGTLRDAMEADGALLLKNVGVRSTPRGEQPRFDFIPNETYQGRFDSVLHDFRAQNSSFEDFVLARLEEASRTVALWITEGWLTARDSGGTIPSDVASTLKLDWEVEFERGPPHLIMLDATGRRRRHVMVNWPQLLECFFSQFRGDTNSLPAPRTDANVPPDGTDRLRSTTQRDQARAAPIVVLGQTIEDRNSSWEPIWLSLPGAIMWVVTRDIALTKSIDLRPNSDRGMILGISVALAMEQHETGEPADQRINLYEAWPTIRHSIGDEKIMAEGRSILREGLIGAIEERLPNMAIPSGDAGNLFISSSVAGIEPKDALAPDEFYRFHNGQGRYWYDVRLKASDVFREFGPTPTTNSQTSPKPENSVGHMAPRAKDMAMSTDQGRNLSMAIDAPGQASPESEISTKPRMRPSFLKITNAFTAEVEAGGRLDELRPVERNARLSDRMKKMGLKDSEIPGDRTFRDYFNKGPGKTEKSG